MARNTFDILALPALLIALVAPGAAFAQEDGRPAPEAPPSGQVTEETGDAPSPAAPNRNTDDYRPSDILEPIEQAHLNRRPIPEGKINFAFDDVEIKDIVPWLAKVTGKIVMPLELDGAGSESEPRAARSRSSSTNPSRSSRPSTCSSAPCG